MPETFRLHNPPVSNYKKILLILLILFFSYITGKVDFINNFANRGLTLQEMEKTYTTVASSRVQKKFTDKDVMGAENYIIRQIAIGQVKAPIVSPTPVETSDPDEPWGVAKKIDTHTYTMQVKGDDVMATSIEIFSALNVYRKQHGRGELSWDVGLAGFAQQRADLFSSSGKLDGHSGFMDYLNNQDGFKKLGFSSLGENSSNGFKLSGVHLIEWVYAGDEEHNSNQLSNDWHYAGIGVSGSATDLVFGGNRL